MAKQAVIEKVAELSVPTATRKREKGEKPKSKTPIKQKCIECGVGYTAEKQVYANGEIVITPKRCEPCQCAKVVGYRVDIIEDKIKLLGNLKARVNKEYGRKGLDAIIASINQFTTDLADRYSGTTIKKVGGFDLKKIKA